MAEDKYISKEATVLDIKTAKDTREWLSKNFLVDKDKGIDDGSSSKSWKPVLIKTNFDSFFDVLKKEAENNNMKICNGTNKDEVLKNIECTKKKIEKSNAFNFLKNSSIWMRLCDNENWDGIISGSAPDSVTKALKEFEWFENLGLYEFKSAKEYLEYNVRAQKENYIAEIGGHDNYVTPTIYSDETTYRNFFIGDDSTDFSFKFLGEEKKADFKTNNVTMRILLVDDKIGCNSEEVNCSICQGNEKCPIKPDSKKEEPCKLKVISKLISGEFICDKEKQKIFNKRTYWSALKFNETEKIDFKVESYVIDSVKISDVWKLSEDGFLLDITNNLKEFLNFKDTNCVQIIGVRDLESALALMSCCKFDIILLDYLLGERTDSKTGRAYGTELFEFLKFKFQDKDNKYKKIDNCPDIVQEFANSIRPKTEADKIMKYLEQFRDEVKLNRGPLDKYWIVPMTSYNSSFIADLQRRNVSLIDYRWNISQGADPINTPWKFLYKLNEFVDLQLRQSVFWKSQLMTFFQYTCEDLEKCLKILPINNSYCFEEFQQFMGAEFANFMKRYGARKIIEHDANSQSPSEISLFAKYIKENFYNEYKCYGVETELNQLMQRFYHRAATMFNERYGQQRLRETFERMRVFIAYNKLEDSIEDNIEKVKLHRGLRFLHTVIDSEFDSEIIKEWIRNNPMK